MLRSVAVPAGLSLLMLACGSDGGGPEMYGGVGGTAAASETSAGGATSTEGSSTATTSQPTTSASTASASNSSTNANGSTGGGSSSTTGSTTAGGSSDTGVGGAGTGAPFGGSNGQADGSGGFANVDTTSGSTDGGGGGGTTPGTGCETVTGDEGTVNQTIVVGSGQTFDGNCQRYRAGSALGNGSQAEGQLPVFRLESGARLINVVLGSPAADGIHTYGDVTLDSIVWEDIGEDALTIKESGTVELTNGSAFNGEDKVFQINAPSTFRVSNFVARTAGKFIRQNGGTTFRIDVYIDNCDISNMSESIFRTDSSSSTVTMTNTRYSNIGDSLFLGVNGNNITESNNTQY